MITPFVDKLRALYTHKQSTLYSSTMVVAITLLAARILGVVKLRVFTGYYSKEQLDLFFAAFRVPDFIFEALIVGSISACFIPLVSGMVSHNKPKNEASMFAQTVATVFVLVWLALLFVMVPFYEQINSFLLPGYSVSQVKMVSSMSLTILFLQVPFLLVGNIAAALLQNEKRFFVPGLAPVFYNIGIILGVVAWGPTLGLLGALYGVVLGAVLYFLIVIPGVLLLGYRFRLQFDLYNDNIRRFFRLFVPRLSSSLIAQIDASVDLALATMRGIGNYSPFYLAKNVQILPVSFLGIAIAQTALPFFSDLYNQGKKKELLELFSKVMSQIFFITIPLVVFLTVLRIPLVRLLLGGQKFDWDGTVLTANVLSLFALSLPFHTAYYVITRVFFALHDTKTTLITGVIFTVLNTVLSFVFVMYYQLSVGFLALAFSISITLNSLVLFFILIRRLDSLSLPAFLMRFGMMGIIGGVTAFVVFLAKNFLDGLVFDTTRTLNLFFFTLSCVAIGVSCYLYLSWIFVPSELSSCMSLFTRLSIFKRWLYRKQKVVYTGEITTSAQEEKNI